MRILTFIVFAAALCTSQEATQPDYRRGDESVLSTNRCVAKRGIGIIGKDLYVDLKSPQNQLILNEGARWNGQDRSMREVAIYFKSTIWSPQALPAGFEVSKSVLVSFEGDKVKFFDFGKMSGGYYERPGQK